MLAPGEAVDVGKTISSAYKRLLTENKNFFGGVDSKCLHTAVTTQRQSVGIKVRGDIGFILFEFNGKAVSQLIFGTLDNYIPLTLGPILILHKYQLYIKSWKLVIFPANL